MGYDSRTNESMRRGFTLVELLVVIGIIALLISILLPSLKKAREAANSIQCLSNLRQIGLMITQYAMDSKGFIPAGAMNETNLSPGRWVYWPERIGRHMNPKATPTRQVGVDSLRCPSRGEDAKWTYGINYDDQGVGWTPSPWFYDPAVGMLVGRKITKLKSSYFLAVDTWGNQPGATVANTWAYVMHPKHFFSVNEDIDADGVNDTHLPYMYLMGPFNGLAPVHGNKSPNFLFVDGSASPKTIRQWVENDGEMWKW